MKEDIKKAIKLLYQEKIKDAYKIIASIIQDMEIVLDGLTSEKYPLVIKMLSYILQLMNEQKTLELAQVLQFDFLPLVYGEDNGAITKEQAAAEGFAAQYNNIEEKAVIIVFGEINIEYMEAIINQCQKYYAVIFYNPNVWNVDYEGMIPDNIYVLSDFTKKEIKLNCKNKCTLSEFPLVLKSCIVESNKDMVYISALPENKERFEEQYTRFRETIQFRLEMISINSYTARTLGHIAVKNNINIFPYLLDGYCVDSFINQFPEDMPAIIVSAGPSLMKNVKRLRRLKNKALIVCVDTAAHIMLKEDIIPDFIVTVDPRKELSLFDDLRIKDIPLIGSSDMSCEVLKKLDCKKLVMTSVKNPFIQQLYKEENHSVEELESGGSVATMAYSFCKLIGIKRIVFVGQDLALTDNQMYAGKKKIEMKNFHRELISVERYGGGTICTTRDYYSYLVWFEQQIQINRELECLNATGGGARIHGAKECSLDDVIENWSLEYFDIEKKIRELMVPVFHDKQAVLDIINNYEKGYFELGQQLEQAMKYALSLQRKHEISDIKQREAEEYIQRTSNLFDESVQSFLILREIDASNLDEYMDICTSDVEMETIEHYKLLERYFRCLLEATQKIQEIIMDRD